MPRPARTRPLPDAHVFRRSAIVALLAASSFLAAPPSKAATAEVLDGVSGADGRITADVADDVAAIRVGDETWVFYGADPGNGRVLRIARLHDDGAQTFRTLDGNGTRSGRTTASVGSDVSALLHDGVVHVFYTNDAGGDLRHAWRGLGDAWRFETVDGHTTGGDRTNRDVGLHVTAIVFRDRVNVFYVDTDRADIRRAVTDGDGWHVSVVDGNSHLGGRTRLPLGAGIAAGVWGAELHVLYTSETYYAGLREVVFREGARRRYSQLRSPSAGRVVLLQISRTEVLGIVEESLYLRPFRWTADGWRISRPTWYVSGGTTGATLVEDAQGAHMALGLEIGQCSDCGYDRYVLVAPWEPESSWTQTREDEFWGSRTGAPNAAVTVEGVAHVFVAGYAETGDDGTLLHITGPFEAQTEG